MIVSVNRTYTNEVMFAYDATLENDDKRYFYVDWLSQSGWQAWEAHRWTYGDINPEEEYTFIGYLPSELL